MITEEEEQRIINKVVEKALLMLPEIVGNLIMNQSNLMKMNREFYQANPDLVNSKDIVAAIVEKIEGENPGLEYKEILARAIPFIKERIKLTKTLNFTDVTKPDRNITKALSDHGVI